MQRNRRRFSFIEFLIVVAVVGILVAVAVPKFIATTKTNTFQNTFGLETSPSHLSEDKRLVIQPFIDAKLEELINQYSSLLKARDSLLLSKNSFLELKLELTLGSVNERLQTLGELNQEIRNANQGIKNADKAFIKACKVAAYFGFEVKWDIRFGPPLITAVFCCEHLHHSAKSKIIEVGLQ